MRVPWFKSSLPVDYRGWHSDELSDLSGAPRVGVGGEGHVRPRSREEFLVEAVGGRRKSGGGPKADSCLTCGDGEREGGWRGPLEYGAVDPSRREGGRAPKDLPIPLVKGTLAAENNWEVRVGPGGDNRRAVLDGFSQSRRDEEIIEVGKIAFGGPAGALRVWGG